MSIASMLSPKDRAERDYDGFNLDEIYEMGWNDCKFKMEEIDVVPVVRCKNCEYGEIDDPDFPDQYFCHSHGCDWNEGDHFCSNGKEKVKERS